MNKRPLNLIVPILALVATAALAAPTPSSKFVNSVCFDPRDHRRFYVVREEAGLDPSNACADPASCSAKYRLESQAEPYRSYRIKSVSVDPDTLTVVLEDTLVAPKKLVFVATDLKKAEKSGYLAVPVVPQLEPVEIDKSEAFETLHGSIRVQYHFLAPRSPAYQDLGKLRHQLSKNIELTDPDQYDRPYHLNVTKVEPLVDDPFVLELTINGAPRGKKVDVVVSGLDTLGGAPVEAKTSMSTTALPKGRDDAAVFVNYGYVTNDVKGEHQYTLDFHVHDVWRSGSTRWDVGPTFDGNVNNLGGKAPNSGLAAIDVRYYFKRWLGFDPIGGISPTYRADRLFDNQDVSVDLMLEAKVLPLEQTLKDRRAEEKRKGGDPFGLMWGWKFRPSVALESGRHIQNLAPDVDGSSFERLRGGVAASAEYGDWLLAGSLEARYLFTDEAVVNEGSVVETSSSGKTWARLDLSYDLGYFAITATHEHGRKPPAFSLVNSTSLGLTVKF